jgi:hypothetical protein
MFFPGQIDAVGLSVEEELEWFVDATETKSWKFEPASCWRTLLKSVA